MIATVFFVLMFGLINYSGIGVAGLLKITGGANILDFEFGYSTARAYSVFESLGNEGRAFYLARILPLDFVFPLSYMAFYFAWIALLQRHVFGHQKMVSSLLLIPIFAMLFDWAENLGVLMMLHRYPTVLGGVCAVSSAMTILKFVGTMLSIGTIAALLIMVLMKRMRRNRVQTE